MTSNKIGLTLSEAKIFLARHGIEWSMDHLRQQVRYGKIKCSPGDGAPKIPKNILLAIVKNRKTQNKSQTQG